MAEPAYDGAVATDTVPEIPKGADTASSPRPFPWWGVVSAAFVFVAIILEVISGSAANSVVPEWAYKVAPLAWPQPVRVLWWLIVACAAGLYRWAERKAGIRRSVVMIVLSIAPFVIFAGGIAFGAEWSTWH